MLLRVLTPLSMRRRNQDGEGQVGRRNAKRMGRRGCEAWEVEERAVDNNGEGRGIGKGRGRGRGREGDRGDRAP